MNAGAAIRFSRETAMVRFEPRAVCAGRCATASLLGFGEPLTAS
jgi:hypothetical protein